MIEIRQTDAHFQWFRSLRDRQARASINARIRRLSLGNPGDAKPVGESVSELRIDYGPGYRGYFVQHGQTRGSVLLASSNKRSSGPGHQEGTGAGKRTIGDCHGED